MEHFPCPKCGGKDRFRAHDDFAETGGIICSQCAQHGCADGIGTIQWKLGIDIHKAIELLEGYLGLARPDLPCKREIAPQIQELRHRIYSWIMTKLAKWDMKPEHLEALKKRGLTDEAINRLGYVSFDGRSPKNAMLAKNIQVGFDEGKVPGLETTKFDDLITAVPGVYRDANGIPRFPHLRGILIPLRDTNGKIVSLKVRRDESPDDNPDIPKYLYFNASKKVRQQREQHDGVKYPTANAAVHVPLHDGIQTALTRVTEGELKADIATFLSGVLTISIPGAGIWKEAIDVLKTLGAQHVLIAFDADHTTNKGVATGMLDLVRACMKAGLKVSIERWAESQGKGIDDVLAAGHKPEVIEGPDVEKYLTDRVEPVAKKEIPPKPQSIEHCRAPDDPYALATSLVAEKFTHEETTTLVSWRDDWLHWNGCRYLEVDGGDLTAQVNQHAQRKVDEDLAKFLATYVPKEGDKPPKAIKVTRNTVSNALQSLDSITRVSSRIEQPSWLGVDSHEMDPKFGFVTKNCILDLKALLRGECKTYPLSPKFFSVRAVNYEFDTAAKCPVWLGFLQSVWGDDRESIALLQEFFGYCLTNDTSQHKYLMMIGPKRAGKTTISETLTQILGEDNVVTPALSGMAERFALEPLIGKTLAICGDAHLCPKDNMAGVTERLLQIVGEDRVNADRKNKTALTAVRLPLRFLIHANEIPSFKDAANAITTRTLMLRLVKTFAGNEDTELKDKITAELPGILNWSIAGLLTLLRRRRFIQPRSGADLLDQMSKQASPISEFVEDCCVINKESFALTDDIHNTYIAWAEERHQTRVVTRETLIKQLRAAYSDLTAGRPKNGGSRGRGYWGIEIRSDAPRKQPGSSTWTGRGSKWSGDGPGDEF